MGKSTILMAILNSYVKLPEGTFKWRHFKAEIMIQKFMTTEIAWFIWDFMGFIWDLLGFTRPGKRLQKTMERSTMLLMGISTISITIFYVANC